jgi:hypothetical protein
MLTRYTQHRSLKLESSDIFHPARGTTIDNVVL